MISSTVAAAVLVVVGISSWIKINIIVDINISISIGIDIDIGIDVGISIVISIGIRVVVCSCVEVTTGSMVSRWKHWSPAHRTDLRSFKPALQTTKVDDMTTLQFLWKESMTFTNTFNCHVITTDNTEIIVFVQVLSCSIL
ncbi:hypothetical protein WICPIJ_001127 [Wickerhamomyces pijperi]|uniref:Uncharacterized protein n=1 Tax=Wickerhamomyces pijperi TaxID=599730 RepID=A0A9P8QEF6_WICPI|nr:hypothetical protein WICPIJ_001127 [Wickerhamomyces pijperi]